MAKKQDKKKKHRERVARKQKQEIAKYRDKVKAAILQGLWNRGFSGVDEALEKAPWVFSELFPNVPPDVIRAALK